MSLTLHLLVGKSRGSIVLQAMKSWGRLGTRLSRECISLVSRSKDNSLFEIGREETALDIDSLTG